MYSGVVISATQMLNVGDLFPELKYKFFAVNSP